MGGFCPLVELHWERSVPAACAAGLLLFFTSNLKEIYVFCYLLYPGTWPYIDKGSVDKCTVVGADNSHLFPIFVSRVMTLTFSFSHNCPLSSNTYEK